MRRIRSPCCARAAGGQAAAVAPGGVMNSRRLISSSRLRPNIQRPNDSTPGASQYGRPFMVPAPLVRSRMTTACGTKRTCRGRPAHVRFER